MGRSLLDWWLGVSSPRATFYSILQGVAVAIATTAYAASQTQGGALSHGLDALHPGNSAVALVVRTLDCQSKIRPLLCTGTLIAPRLVVTAAHCLRRHPPAGLDVVFGDSVDGAPVRVATGIVHPGFNETTHANDLALLFLAEEAPSGILPATIRTAPLDGSLMATPVRWVGYGAPRGRSGETGTKREATALVLDIREDEVRYGAIDLMSCGGDSGGPLFAASGNFEELIGVTTWGDPGCKRFGVAVRIDRYTEFLYDFLQKSLTFEGRRRAFDPDEGLSPSDCRSDADCPDQTTCFGWPGQSRWCTYGGLPPGRFTRACTMASECGSESRCVSLPGGCRCFEPHQRIEEKLQGDVQ
jgi:V8-like Glu-specific endopeptidase